MAVQRLGQLLGTAREFAALLQRSRRLAQWHDRYANCAPPALARASRVAGFRSGTLILRADNAAVAAKLKQLAPRLMTALNQQANEVTSIRVQVQPAGAAQRPPGRSAVHDLPPRAIEEFARLSATVKDSPLKKALERLVARHRGGSLK